MSDGEGAPGWHTYEVPVRVEREGFVYIRARSKQEASDHAETLNYHELDDVGAFTDDDRAKVTDGSIEIDDCETYGFHVDENAEQVYDQMLDELETHLDNEHCDPCGSCTGCPNTCDIHKAFEHSLFLLAADVMVHGTDSGNEGTTKCYQKIRKHVGDKEFEKLLNDQKKQFAELVNAMQCPSCKTQVYLDEEETGGTCGSCGSAVGTAPPPASEDDDPENDGTD